MFKHILIPLDGSLLAEQALAPASRIAEKFSARLLLLRVVTGDRPLPGFPYLAARPSSAPASAPHPLFEEAEAYLSGLRLPNPLIAMRSRVLAGAPPELIIATAAEEQVDLIVMSTHGRAGLTRLLYGSVAEAVLRGATVPVMMVPSRAFARQSAEHLERPPVPREAS
jgi:nucleotide-binding universal stress UspA family protein